MKKLFKILLPVCILLFGGYIRLAGHALGGSFEDSAHKDLVPVNLFPFTCDCQELVVKSVLSDVERQNGLNHAAKVEEKEDELQSFKKQLDFNNNLSVAFFNKTTRYFFHNTQQLLFSYNNISYIPVYSALFLRLGVLRI